MQKYHISQRIIHWLMALLIITLLILGFSLDFLPKTYKFPVIKIHKSLGIIALFLIFIRIYLRLKYKAPSLPQDFLKFEKILSNLVHKTLYLSMLIMPLSGWLMSNSYGKQVQFFNFFTLPTLLEKNILLTKIFSNIHYYTAWTLVICLSLHITGVIKHSLEKKSVLPRML